ncbi:hypothetical protein RRG08_022706 [Elysia crispata]|uniref:C-type lectin domain-containing protein n=1 Tax=Elysia crispata TaxID=231223 RepID=A0AAE1DEK3_9GAST|nr:hypothetical protein RRG08_022706 [Elysia crispata]
MNQLLTDKISSYATYAYWIGLHDRYEEGKFFWREEIDLPRYTNEGFCGLKRMGWTAILNSKDGKWYLKHCDSEKHKFICEKSPGPNICLENAKTLSFGSRCQYRCRCMFEGSKCSLVDGQCEFGCQTGYFGPACQYAKMNFTVGENPLEGLTDGNDTTCNTGDIGVVTLILDTPIPLTWIRVVLKSADLPVKMSLFHKSISLWETRPVKTLPRPD